MKYDTYKIKNGNKLNELIGITKIKKLMQSKNVKSVSDVKLEEYNILKENGILKRIFPKATGYYIDDANNKIKPYWIGA